MKVLMLNERFGSSVTAAGRNGWVAGESESLPLYFCFYVYEDEHLDFAKLSDSPIQRLMMAQIYISYVVSKNQYRVLKNRWSHANVCLPGHHASAGLPVQILSDIMRVGIDPESQQIPEKELPFFLLRNRSETGQPQIYDLDKQTILDFYPTYSV